MGRWGVTTDAQRAVVNGAPEPEPMVFRVGERYRMRFINMSADDEKSFRLLEGGEPVEWTLVAKDGANLPAALVQSAPAVVPHIGVGETYDFIWTPTTAGERILEIVTGYYPGGRVGRLEWRVNVR